MRTYVGESPRKNKTEKAMNAKKILKAVASPLLAVALIAGFSVASTAPASASSIKDGWVQLCPWGNYKVHLEYSDATSGISHTLSPTLNPGAACWWGQMPTGSRSALIFVVGHFNTTGGTFDVIGPDGRIETFYDGKSGIGIAAEGTTEFHGVASHYYRY
ncbi:hypothetical protein [Streptomyces sp. ok210]|jgi:hypothetical protein|uniref:hypothetical protein n=1 Tax=Streptomyces sp. ok210 TaxID=1761905 RepID=UPI0008F37444|nr:hypothetical protein [Streptomyces sp. ok210]SFT31942.1 hypothetical protein SAMN04487982_1277 [Streptomyces sp. ok210]